MNYTKLQFTCSCLLVPGNDVDDNLGGGYHCWGRISESDALSPHPPTVQILTFS